nr:MAG TPA: hypothetical protein [Caudoviricetes sp.]
MLVLFVYFFAKHFILKIRIVLFHEKKHHC